MMRFAWFVIALAALPQDKAKEAEAAFNKMAEGLEKAKTARIKFTATMEEGSGGGDKMELKGTICFKEGNKLRIELDDKNLYVCDGAKGRGRVKGELKDAVDAFKTLSADVASVETRVTNALMATEIFKDLTRGANELFGKDQKLKLTEFKAGEKDGDNLVVSYNAALDDKMPPLHITAWIDAKSSKLVKRKGEVKTGDKVEFSFSETIEEWAIGVELADDLFKLPEK